MNKCYYCEDGSGNIEDLHICTDCDNEFAEFLEQRGLVVGEFDNRSHPNFQPDALKGTKWDK
jgi:hypothetical protein